MPWILERDRRFWETYFIRFQCRIVWQVRGTVPYLIRLQFDPEDAGYIPLRTLHSERRENFASNRSTNLDWDCLSVTCVIKVISRKGIGGAWQAGADWLGRAVAQAVIRQLPTARPRFEPTSNNVGFVEDKKALGNVFLEYFSFPCHSLHWLLIIIHHPGLLLTN